MSKYIWLWQYPPLPPTAFVVVPSVVIMVMDFVPSLCFFPRHKASLHGRFTCAASKARAVIPVLRKFTVARLLGPRCMWTFRFAGAHLFEFGGQLDNIEPKSYSPSSFFPFDSILFQDFLQDRRIFKAKPPFVCSYSRPIQSMNKLFSLQELIRQSPAFPSGRCLVPVLLSWWASAAVE